LYRFQLCLCAFVPGATRSLESRMSDWISVVADWMSSNRLQLNATKTEILWCTSSRRQHQLPVTQLTVDNDQVTPVTSVRKLGIYMDSDLSMRTRHPNCCRLLRCSASHQKYSTVRHPTSATVACGGFSAISCRLWQHCAVRITTTAGRQASVSPERSGTIGARRPST